MNHALPQWDYRPLGTEQEKQQIHFEIADTFIRIPLSGILIKFLYLRSLRLCGEILLDKSGSGRCINILSLGPFFG